MAVTETTPRAATARTRTSGWYRARRRQGLLYALPTAIYVAVFFVMPLILVARMSLGNWTLLGGASATIVANELMLNSASLSYTQAVCFQPWQTCSDHWTIR